MVSILVVNQASWHFIPPFLALICLLTLITWYCVSKHFSFISDFPLIQSSVQRFFFDALQADLNLLRFCASCLFKLFLPGSFSSQFELLSFPFSFNSTRFKFLFPQCYVAIALLLSFVLWSFTMLSPGFLSALIALD